MNWNCEQMVQSTWAEMLRDGLGPDQRCYTIMIHGRYSSVNLQFSLVLQVFILVTLMSNVFYGLVSHVLSTCVISSAALKEAIDDLEWPGSSIKLTLQPTPPSVAFRSEGHGDLQIDFMYYANTDLLAALSCDREVSHRYKYKFLQATTSNIPSSVVKDNRGSKVTVGRGGILKVQHLVSVARQSHPHIDSAGYQPPSRIVYIEFFVKPEEVEDN
ncbi:uncharacterized protein LOC130801078 [Amaranthus tricolor]|uniref:uncharacterized protein LOC130801078 n=1 Tax=Amaranthus tricolor TaxID=29722 RepID=UPI00258BAF31|nr:uncharacterized protein LOC130801078 [Amaranthus tricolor]